MNSISRTINEFHMAPIELGVDGDDSTSLLQIDVSSWDAEFPGATYEIAFLRQGESVSYPIPSTYAAGMLSAQITSTETELPGKNGQMQVIMTAGSAKRRTPVTTVTVYPNIGDTGSTPPAPADTWLESVIATKNTAVAAKDAAEQALADMATAEFQDLAQEYSAELQAINAALPKWINVVGLGADDTGVADCYSIINGAITDHGGTAVIYAPKGTYKLDTGLTLTSPIQFICEGDINYTGAGYAITIKCPLNKIKIGTLNAPSGGGVKFLSDTELIYENDVNIGRIVASTNGIEMTTAGYGVQYNVVEFGVIDVDGKAIYLNAVTAGKSVGENRFKKGMLQGEYGTYLTGSYEGAVTGNRFINVGLEGVTNAIYLKNTAYNSFADCRAQEQITNKYLIFEGRNYGNRIGLDMCLISAIDLSLATTGNNFVESYCMNNPTNYELVTRLLRINGTRFECAPFDRKLKNLYIPNPASYTADINADSLYNLYTDFMLNTNVVFTIGRPYYSLMFTDLLLSIPAGVTVKDADNNTIIASGDATYNGKVIRVRRLTPNFGVAKWQVEIVTTIS
jgi:hypothetical protein